MVNQCVKCAWFKLKPGNKHVGVCFYRYVPDALVEGSRWDMGAYGKTSQWKSCANWVERGTVEEYEPTPTAEPKDDDPPSRQSSLSPCERCGEMTRETPRMTIDGRNVTLCKPCFNWAMDCTFRGVADNWQPER